MYSKLAKITGTSCASICRSIVSLISLKCGTLSGALLPKAQIVRTILMIECTDTHSSNKTFSSNLKKKGCLKNRRKFLWHTLASILLVFPISSFLFFFFFFRSSARYFLCIPKPNRFSVKFPSFVHLLCKWVAQFSTQINVDAELRNISLFEPFVSS